MLRPNRHYSSFLASRVGGIQAAAHVSAQWSAVAARNGWMESSIPGGYPGPRSGSVPAIRSGSMATRRGAGIIIAGSSVGELGAPFTASGGIAVAGSADGALIASATASGGIVLSGAAILDGVINGAASGTLTVSGSAQVDGVASLSAAGMIALDGLAQIMGLGSMEATNTDTSGLTPTSIAKAVWEALAAASNSAGSMGEKLNAAGSASNPWTDPDGIAVLERLTEIWRIHGLKPGEPMTVTPTGRTAGSITQTIAGDPTAAVTVTRA